MYIVETAMVRWAVIGTNVITENLIAASKLVPEFELVGVYSRTAERAAEFAAKHGCCLTFTNMEELARSDAIDAVYVASPTSEHAKQCSVLLRHRKHVLCEKPACSNAAELMSVLDAARESGCAFMEAMRPLKTPNFLRVLESLRELGQVRHFAGSFCQLSSRWPAYCRGERPNAFINELSNGCVMDIGCYAVYAAVRLFGEPLKVSYTPIMLETRVDGAGTLVLTYEGMICTLVISKMSHGWSHSEIQTDKATIRIDNLGEFAEVHQRSKGGQAENIGVEQHPNNMTYEIEAFCALVNQGKQQDDILTWELALSVARVLDAARRDAGVIFPADRD